MHTLSDEYSTDLKFVMAPIDDRWIGATANHLSMDRQRHQVPTLTSDNMKATSSLTPLARLYIELYTLYDSHRSLSRS